MGNDILHCSHLLKTSSNRRNKETIIKACKILSVSSSGDNRAVVEAVSKEVNSNTLCNELLKIDNMRTSNRQYTVPSVQYIENYPTSQNEDKLSTWHDAGIQNAKSQAVQAAIRSTGSNVSKVLTNQISVQRAASNIVQNTLQTGLDGYKSGVANAILGSTSQTSAIANAVGTVTNTMSNSIIGTTATVALEAVGGVATTATATAVSGVGTVTGAAVAATAGTAVGGIVASGAAATAAVGAMAVAAAPIVATGAVIGTGLSLVKKLLK